MYREDIIFIDKKHTYFSLTRDGPGHDNGPWETFSERMRRVYPGYQLDQNMRIRASPNTRVVNLCKLENLLRSKDESLWL